MKVKLTGHWGEHNPGETVDVDDATAEQLLGMGLGHEAREPAAKDKDKS